MKLRNIFATILISVSYAAISQDREQLAVHLTDPNKEAKLNVSLVTGSIKVVGYAGKDILIDAISKEENEEAPKKTKNGLRKISSTNGFELTATEKNNKVNVSVDQMNKKIDVIVKVPKNCSLVLSAINDGDINVEGVSGNHEISNINGYIKMKNIQGSVLANTINEDINVIFTHVTANTPMAFTTLNGNVEVSFPADIHNNVKLKSDMGDVFSDFDIDIDKSTKKTKTVTSKEKGMYKIVKEDWTTGKINGGGAEIMMKTMNGDIYFSKLK